MASPTIFYDSARFGLIPAKADAALYFDGRYRATPEQAKRFGRTRWITVLGGADAAAHTGAIDYEHGNLAYEPGRLRAWAGQRRAMGKRFRVYTNRSDLGRAMNELGNMPGAEFWVATLDGKQWSAAALLADIKLAHRIALNPSSLWAIQFDGGMTAPYDRSILVGAW